MTTLRKRQTRRWFPWMFSMGVTALLFAAIGWVNLLSIRRADARPEENAGVSVAPPEMPKFDPPPPPPEEKKEKEEPKLDEPDQHISLVDLEAALNPGPGPDGWGRNMGPLIGAVDPLDELRIFNPDDLEEQPNPIQRVAPQYPYEAVQGRINGWVKVAFVVDENGNVRDPRVDSSSNRMFERAALDAIRLWKFTPGRKDNENVRTRMLLPFQFNLSR